MKLNWELWGFALWCPHRGALRGLKGSSKSRVVKFKCKALKLQSRAVKLKCRAVKLKSRVLKLKCRAVKLVQRGNTALLLPRDPCPLLCSGAERFPAASPTKSVRDLLCVSFSLLKSTCAGSKDTGSPGKEGAKSSNL